MITFTELQSFMRLLHKVQNVKRVARVPDETEYRNTAEHTFEMTMVCWYLMSGNNLVLNHEKVLKYALAHDVIEAYSGDTYIYDTEAQKTKKEREANALKQLEEDFKEFPELITILHAYESRGDDESRFVYAVDKLVDPLNCSMETLNSFLKEHNISLDDVHEYKDAKIAQSAHVIPYWQQVLLKFEERQDFFFHP